MEVDLERMVKPGKLRRLITLEWASPTVPLIKSDGSVRQCGDYKVTINPHLHVNHHLLPRPDELFATLNEELRFTKLDLSSTDSN